MSNIAPKLKHLLIAAGLCATLSSNIQAEEASWKYTLGTDYSSGDYGDPADTKMLYLPFSASYQKGPWTTKVTAAWLRIDGPGTVIGGGDGGVVIPGDDTATSVESGFGDIWASTSYELQSFPSEFGFLDLTAKVKLPTADDDKNLGTGEADYTFQADYAYAMGQLTPLATIAYKVKGESDDLKLDNVWFVSAGADWKLSDQTHIGATLDFQQSASAADDSLELFTYVNYKLSNEWKVTPYLYFGLSDSSPDHGLGMQFTYRP